MDRVRMDMGKSIIHFIHLLTLLGRGGAESARTFFNRPLLQEKRGLEVPNFVTFPNSL